MKFIVTKYSVLILYCETLLWTQPKSKETIKLCSDPATNSAFSYYLAVYRQLVYTVHPEEAMLPPPLLFSIVDELNSINYITFAIFLGVFTDLFSVLNDYYKSA